MHGKHCLGGGEVVLKKLNMQESQDLVLHFNPGWNIA
jgi:hypothetical protein